VRALGDCFIGSKDVFLIGLRVLILSNFSPAEGDLGGVCGLFITGPPPKGVGELGVLILLTNKGEGEP
jgi:hypothetical protein